MMMQNEPAQPTIAQSNITHSTIAHSTIALCNCMAVRRASRRISQYYDARLAPFGLRATQFAILALIEGQGELPVNGVADALDLDRSTAGQNLRPLERDGLVEMARSSADGRARIVRLTALGGDRLGQAKPAWQQAQKAFEAINADPACLRTLLGGIAIPAE
jgi:DNA-binding MarR family transcriptional regulator